VPPGEEICAAWVAVCRLGCWLCRGVAVMPPGLPLFPVGRCRPAIASRTVTGRTVASRTVAGRTVAAGPMPGRQRPSREHRQPRRHDQQPRRHNQQPGGTNQQPRRHNFFSWRAPPLLLVAPLPLAVARPRSRAAQPAIQAAQTTSPGGTTTSSGGTTSAAGSTGSSAGSTGSTGANPPGWWQTSDWGVTSVNWHGCVWTGVDCKSNCSAGIVAVPNSTTSITPLDFTAATKEGGPYEVTGTVFNDYNSVALLGST